MQDALGGTCEPPYTYFYGRGFNGSTATSGSDKTGQIALPVDSTPSSTGVSNSSSEASGSGSASQPTVSGGGCQIGSGNVNPNPFAAILFGALAVLGLRRERIRSPKRNG
jgi:hypothetical protein